MRGAKLEIVGGIGGELVLGIAHLVLARDELRRARHELHQAARSGSAAGGWIKFALLPRQPEDKRTLDGLADLLETRHGLYGIAPIVDVQAVAPDQLGEANRKGRSAGVGG